MASADSSTDIGRQCISVLSRYQYRQDMKYSRVAWIPSDTFRTLPVEMWHRVVELL